MNKSNRNVIIFGESGSGKSSLVNLLLGQERANVSDKAVGCTFNFQEYATPNFNVYDTVGLSEGMSGTVRPDLAIKELMHLLQSLHHGVALLIFVIQKGRIKKSLNKNYNLFVDGLCMKNVPVVLVITHCEMETVPGTWWNENQQHFERYGMTFRAVVSGSALQPKSAPEMMRPVVEDLNNKTVVELLNVINSSMLVTPWQFAGGWFNWFYAIAKKIACMMGKVVNAHYHYAAEVHKQHLAEFFKSHGYSSAEADEMIQHFKADSTPESDDDESEEVVT
ncbi:uncharacterized protein LOC119071289 [Bradysia coprophila]|uniref:uncharacterized protein LOC119071289 n=1 Tax=Bradysia coprophila TaxID=38358 RepID=UPI00187DB06C|nr:uncharacterized protein LOC119071289 [Bradysia coprophila]XP_037032055.1 uncharacterized protein LOC119071289 [Bradysia coprophila]